MVLHRVPILLFAVMVGGRSAAQDKPDFSGRWVLEAGSQSDSEIPRALSVTRAVTRLDVPREPTRPFVSSIAIDREFEGGVESETRRIDILGGTVPGISRDGRLSGAELRHSTIWEENTLVFWNGSYSDRSGRNGGWLERREAWSLDNAGRLNVVITTHRSDAKAHTVTAVYQRTR